MTNRTGFRFVSVFATMVPAQTGFAGMAAFGADPRDRPVPVDLRHVLADNPSGTKAIPDHELAQLRGAGFPSFLSNIVSALPEGSTAAAEADLVFSSGPDGALSAREAQIQSRDFLDLSGPTLVARSPDECKLTSGTNHGARLDDSICSNKYSALRTIT